MSEQERERERAKRASEEAAVLGGPQIKLDEPMASPHREIFSVFLLFISVRPSPPLVLPPGFGALPAGFRALPAGSEALPAGSEALPASSKAHPA